MPDLEMDDLKAALAYASRKPQNEYLPNLKKVFL